MAEIYDFTKYLSERQIEMYETEQENTVQCFGCPDCGSVTFMLMLDMTAECSDCEFSVYLEGDEE